ncbi:Lrp/AsnC family transcriptional regulator [Streptomyces beihaiensis]|uniref:Lrp/AsnC family transcriptional regulator n=1 Tax=Streptomyces beihaiensis TaxID=2984495 RepID=A0ABT3U1H1_9ACTN|nr:Lrp/AsnC family transcriptional regulator [Streptomyces beihaiensis]MCX3063167.1 Lrp/AsnC family transcriptional regulator [Streptomyces beihaiensis]
MQDLVDEVDLELVHALQLNPRASWTALGHALSLDAVTVARRWERLRDAGLAWTSSVPGPVARTGMLSMLYVEFECETGGTAAAVDHLLAKGHVIYLHHMTGTRCLLASVVVADLPAASTWLREQLGAVPGVRAAHAELLVTTYSEANRWRLGTLEPAQQQTLRPSTATVTDEPARPLDAVDQALVRALTTDARLPATELAERIGVSEPTARRRLARMMSDGRIRMRCEIAQSVSGWPVMATLWCRVPAQRLGAVARAAGSLPEVRLSIGLTGSDNLMLMVWLRDPAHLPDLESALAGRFPELTIARRAVCLRTFKLMGRLLDEHGLAVGSVPVDIWRQTGS